MVSDEALKKLQEQIAAWPMTQRFVVQQLIEDYRRNREDLRAYKATGLTSERCAEFARADAEGRYIVMRDAEQEGVARLRELAEADKDGRLVVHGRWEHLGGDEWCCSACGFVITTEGSWDKPTKKYCEDCGAKMDGGDSDAAD